MCKQRVGTTEVRPHRQSAARSSSVIQNQRAAKAIFRPAPPTHTGTNYYSARQTPIMQNKSLSAQVTTVIIITFTLGNKHVQFKSVANEILCNNVYLLR